MYHKTYLITNLAREKVLHRSRSMLIRGDHSPTAQEDMFCLWLTKWLSIFKHQYFLKLFVLFSNNSAIVQSLQIDYTQSSSELPNLDLLLMVFFRPSTSSPL